MSLSKQYTNPKISKVKQFIQQYLDNKGCSCLIKRYELHPPLAYTSGDGIFRSDGDLGKKYKFVRFSKNLNLDKKISNCWKRTITSEEKEMLVNIHSNLNFSKNGTIVELIQFFGLSENPLIDQGIKKEILEIIHNKPCVNCGTHKDIECDHKNDLKNDHRVLIKDTQTIDDFQPLCKHCNDVKRGMKAKMENTGKRIGATQLGFSIDFTEGDETLDRNDPYWYKGTYWGDCLDFKKKLSLTIGN